MFLFLMCLPTFAGWRISSNIDPMTDTKTQIAILSPLSDSGHSWLSKTSLLVRCDADNHLDIYFDFPFTYLGDNDGCYDIQYRIDKQEPKTICAEPSTDSTAAFLSDTQIDEMLKPLADGARLTIRIEPYDGTPRTAVFSLAGSTAALKSVLGVCDTTLEKEYERVDAQTTAWMKRDAALALFQEVAGRGVWRPDDKKFHIAPVERVCSEPALPDYIFCDPQFNAAWLEGNL